METLIFTLEDINLTTIHLISVIVSKILEKFIYHTLYIYICIFVLMFQRRWNIYRQTRNIFLQVVVEASKITNEKLLSSAVRIIRKYGARVTASHFTRLYLNRCFCNLSCCTVVTRFPALYTPLFTIPHVAGSKQRARG